MSQSPYAQLQIKQEFHLPPIHCKNIGEGIERIMLDSLMKYIPSLGGVLICYSNLKILSNSVGLYWEFPEMHVDVQMDVILFRPQVGQSLTGIVTSRGTDYLSLIVENTWEAHIHIKHVDREKTKQDKGDEIKFFVKKVIEVDQMVSLQGVLALSDI